jgi:hypothetical protein
MNADQVDLYGRLFARIMDKRDGVGSQAAVDEAIAELTDHLAKVDRHILGETGEQA